MHLFFLSFALGISKIAHPTLKKDPYIISILRDNCLLVLLQIQGEKPSLKTPFLAHFLSMHIDAYCNTEATTSLIRQHIPAASLIQENTEQLVYTLPLKDMDKFAGICLFTSLLGCRREIRPVRP